MAMEIDEITEKAIGAAIEVHRALGPGLLESAYQACVAAEFVARGIRFQREVAIPVRYRNELVDCAFRVDFVVEDAVLLEIKAVQQLHPIDRAQMMTYLKL